MKGTAIVTGGAKRIGRAIALALADLGYDIALHYNTSQFAAEEVANLIKDKGRSCHLFACDFNNMKQVKSFIPQIFKIFPNCDLLINSASIFERARMMDTDEDLFDRHFIINFKTPFFLTRDFAHYYKKGQIINILDTKISKTLIEYFAYTLSKKSLFEFTKMAAKELAPYIRVNGVCPGLILPPPGKDEDYLNKMSERIPLQRKGDTQCIVAAVAFLIENDFVTGEWIFVDGGEHLK